MIKRNDRLKGYKTPTSAFWCETINNPTEADYQRQRERHDGKYTLEYQAGVSVIYEIVGREGFNGPTYLQKRRGIVPTRHLQGYIVFDRQMTFKEVKNLFPRAHIEMAKSHIGSAMYCRKENSFDEYGEWDLTTEMWENEKSGLDIWAGKEERQLWNKQREAAMDLIIGGGDNRGGGKVLPPPPPPTISKDETDSREDELHKRMHDVYLWEIERLNRNNDDL